MESRTHFDVGRFTNDEELGSIMYNFIGLGMKAFHFNIMSDTFDDFLELLKKEYPNMKVKFLKNKKIIHLHNFQGYNVDDSKEFHVYIETVLKHGKFYSSYLFAYDIFEPIVSHFDAHSDNKVDHEFGISYYFMGSHGLDDYTIHKKTTDFNYIIPELYTGINLELLADTYINSNENVLILLGSPGVGKTTFIKYLLRRMVDNALTNKKIRKSRYELASRFSDYFAAYAKGNDVIGKEEFWASLTSNKYKMLILDDLDFALLPRDKEQNNFMSNFLSFSDGVFDIKTKIVITTNLNFTDIDQALLRPGRCFDVLSLKPLDRWSAKSVWINQLKMSEESFNKEFLDASEINQSTLMAEYEKQSKDNSLSYLIDKSISVRNSYKGKRKPGFGK